MAADYDVGARIAEGRPVVGEVAEYVLACQLLGHRYDGLSPLTVDELYLAEDGMRLATLAADAEALTRLAEAADELVQRQLGLNTATASAWEGAGAVATREFLARQHRNAQTCAARVRLAADTLVKLRTALWEAVDAKVTATLDFIVPHEAQRAAWLGAARTVAGAPGDRATASELIDLEVKPFVERDVHGAWMAAMRGGTTRVGALYDEIGTLLRDLRDVAFEVPDALGPPPEPPPPAPAVGTAPAAAPPPVAAAPPGVAGPPPMPDAPQATGALPQQVLPESGSLPTPMAPPGALGGSSPAMPGLSGMSGLGGLSGLGQQLADVLGGLVGSAQGGLPEPTDLDPIDPVEPEELEESEEAEPDEVEEEPEEDPEEPEEPVAEPESEEPEPPPTPVPDALPPPPLPPPDIPAEPVEPVVEVAQTPCEVAATELPQVGE